MPYLRHPAAVKRSIHEISYKHSRGGLGLGTLGGSSLGEGFPLPTRPPPRSFLATLPEREGELLTFTSRLLTLSRLWSFSRLPHFRNLSSFSRFTLSFISRLLHAHFAVAIIGGDYSSSSITSP